MPAKKISTDEVEIGMYVTRLDRPWSETPFLFQGFPVREQSEIQQLKDLCRHVYIMVPDEEIEINELPKSYTAEPVPEDAIGQKQYKTTVSAKDEVKAVREAHDELVGVLSEVESMILGGDELNMSRVKKSIDVMIGSIQRNPDAFIWLNRIKKFDSYIYRDAVNASVWATTLGRELGLKEDLLQELATGALVMDIGKTALPPELLQKSERLTDDEWAIMKTHVEHGVRILSEADDVSPRVLEIVRTHHERLDGSGYPSVLKGDSIPILGQIAGIVDFYVAVTTPRPYSSEKLVSPSQATYMLYQQQGQYFSETLVKRFIQAICTYPTGSLVQLSNGEVGVVISQNVGVRLRPNVLLILNPDKQPYHTYSVVSLIDYKVNTGGQPVTISKTLADGSYGIRIEELTL